MDKSNGKIQIADREEELCREIARLIADVAMLRCEIELRDARIESQSSEIGFLQARLKSALSVQ